MKQNLSKVLLAALVIPTFIGGATVSHAAEENSSSIEHEQALDAQDAYNKAYEEFYKNDGEVVIEDLDNVKENAKKELKENGVESDFFLKEVDKAKTKEGVESLKGELLESHKNSKKEEKPSDKKEDKKEEDKKDEKKSIPLTKIEDIAKPNKKEEEKETPSKENNEVGFSSKEKAEKAAKKALENDEINKSFTISEKDGKFFYALSPAEDLSDVKEKEEEDKKEEKPFAKLDEKADEKSFDFDKGFKTKEDAIKQAEFLIKNSKINKGYNVSEGADGRYYIQLTPETTKTEGVERKEIKNKDTKEEKKEESKEKETSSNPAKKTNDNVKTGVGALTGVSMTLISAAAALKKTKRK